ncbi:hypothetical protein BY996DRAFT_4586006, partial [Phakopsora pachyrhizi]
GTFPNSSKSPFGLSKLLSPVSLLLRIDNPIIFLHPKPLPTFEQLQDSPQSSIASIVSRQTSPRESPLGSQNLNVQNNSNGEHQATFSNFTIGGEPAPVADDEHRAHATNNRGTVLSGTLLLKISKPKELKKIVISLWGQSYIGFNDRPYEHQTVIAKDIKIDLMNQLIHMRNQHPNPGSVTYNQDHNTFLLDKGDYWFGWSFILPSELPPYERGQFGRTTHKVIAKVKFASGLGLGVKSMGKNLSSMLAGASGGGHEIEAESYFVAICNPEGLSEETGNNLTLDFNVNDVSEHLGQYSLTASSSYFTVAGLISFKFRLNQIPQKHKIIKIYKITCFIKQQYRLISMKDKDSKTGTPAQSLPPCQRRKVFVLDYSNSLEPEPVYANGDPARGLDSIRLRAPPESSNLNWIPNGTALNTRPSSPSGEAPSASNSSNSRSRSRIRDLMMTPSCESAQNEHIESIHHLAQPWNGLSSFFHSHRREENSRQSSAHTEKSVSHTRMGSRSSSSEHLQNVPDNPPSHSVAEGLDHQLSGGCQETNCAPSIRSQTDTGFSLNLSAQNEEPTGNISYDDRELNIFNGALQQPTNSSSSAPLPGVINRGRESTPLTPANSRGQKKNNSSRSRGRKLHARDRGNNVEVESERPIVTLTDEHLSWEIQHMDRLPNDDIIRPSTQPGTNTTIHISHTLIFEISYSVEDSFASRSPSEGNFKVATGSSNGSGKIPPLGNKTMLQQSAPALIAKKVLSIGKPVHIYSCCCMAESMTLPPYSAADPHPEIVQHPTPQHADRMVKCVCGM